MDRQDVSLCEGPLWRFDEHENAQDGSGLSGRTKLTPLVCANCTPMLAPEGRSFIAIAPKLRAQLQLMAGLGTARTEVTGEAEGAGSPSGAGSRSGSGRGGRRGRERERGGGEGD